MNSFDRVDIINFYNEDLINIIIEKRFVDENFLLRKMNEYTADMINENDQVKISNVIDKAKSWIEMAKNVKEARAQSMLYLETLIAERLRIDEITSGEYSPINLVSPVLTNCYLNMSWKH